MKNVGVAAAPTDKDSGLTPPLAELLSTKQNKRPLAESRDGGGDVLDN